MEICSAISSHITIAWRCALLLVMTVSSLRGRDCASLKAKRMMRSTPARVIIDTSVAASIGWPWCTRPPTPEYSPSEFSRTMTQFEVVRAAALQRAVDAGQDARRPHVGVLVEALADLQAQAPERDVVGDVRVAGRAEQDRVLVAQRVQAVVRHHHAVLAVVVAAPVEVLELEAEGCCSTRPAPPAPAGRRERLPCRCRRRGWWRCDRSSCQSSPSWMRRATVPHFFESAASAAAASAGVLPTTV